MMRQDKYNGRIHSLAVIFVLALVFSTLSLGQAMAGEHRGRSVRERLNTIDRILLVMEEDRSLSFEEAAVKVLTQRDMPDVGPGAIGLSERERKALVHGEKRDAAARNRGRSVLKASERMGPVGLGYHKPYIRGSFRENLNDTERERLEREERK